MLPVFNELSILPRLTEALVENLERTGGEYEIIYVNDGSSDGSEDLLDSGSWKIEGSTYSENDYDM